MENFSPSLKVPDKKAQISFGKFIPAKAKADKKYYDLPMIYRNSQDPVLLKKINIDVWLLRDELEYIVMARLNSNPDSKTFDDLYEEFSLKPTPKLRLIKNDDSENEAESEVNPEEKDENSSNDTEEKDQEKSDQKEIIIQRVPQLPQEKVSSGRTFLAEIYMDQILFFSNKQFTEGQSIVISFNIPEKFILNAEVTYSQSYSLKNRILSETTLPYRICAKFSFLRKGERTLLRNFLEKVEFRPELEHEENDPASIESNSQDSLENESPEENGDDPQGLNAEESSEENNTTSDSNDEDKESA